MPETTNTTTTYATNTTNDPRPCWVIVRVPDGQTRDAIDALVLARTGEGTSSIPSSDLVDRLAQDFMTSAACAAQRYADTPADKPE